MLVWRKSGSIQSEWSFPSLSQVSVIIRMSSELEIAKLDREAALLVNGRSIDQKIFYIFELLHVQYLLGSLSSDSVRVDMKWSTRESKANGG